MIVKLFKGWLTSKLNDIITMGVVLVFVLGVFVVPILLFSLGLHHYVILIIYLPFLYYWLGPMLQNAQKWANIFSQKVARWIQEN